MIKNILLAFKKNIIFIGFLILSVFVVQYNLKHCNYELDTMKKLKVYSAEKIINFYVIYKNRKYIISKYKYAKYLKLFGDSERTHYIGGVRKTKTYGYIFVFFNDKKNFIYSLSLRPDSEFIWGRETVRKKNGNFWSGGYAYNFQKFLDEILKIKPEKPENLTKEDKKTIKIIEKYYKDR